MTDGEYQHQVKVMEALPKSRVSLRSPIESLLRYYQGCAQDLERRANDAGLFQNNPDAGDKREKILADFLDRHLPERCKVAKGDTFSIRMTWSQVR